MRRADRLFRIVQLLRGGRLTTADKLAEQLEVSARTIYRDIRDLQASGVPVDGEAGVGYIMAKGYDLPPLMFDRDEITALVAGARLLRAFGGLEMALAAEEALVKIEAVLPEDVQQRAASVGVEAIAIGISLETRQLIDRIEAAVQARERLEISYSDEAGARTERIINPFSVTFWGKVWTAIAWCELREDFRMFRLDRIIELEGDLGTFRPVPGRTLRDYFQYLERCDRETAERSHDGAAHHTELAQPTRTPLN